MSPSAIREQLAQVTGIDVEDLTDEARLDTLAIDSIEVVVWTMELERALGVDLFDALRLEVATVGELCRLVERLTRADLGLQPRAALAE